jgi:hypothetical protein
MLSNWLEGFKNCTPTLQKNGYNAGAVEASTLGHTGAVNFDWWKVTPGTAEAFPGEVDNGGSP